MCAMVMFKVWLNSTEKHTYKTDVTNHKLSRTTNRTIKDLERKEYGGPYGWGAHSVETYIIQKQLSEKHNWALTVLGCIQEASNGTQNLLWTCSDLSRKTILEPLSVLPVLLTHKLQPCLIAVGGSYTTVFPISARKGSPPLSPNENKLFTSQFSIIYCISY